MNNKAAGVKIIPRIYKLYRDLLSGRVGEKKNQLSDLVVCTELLSDGG